MRQDGRLQCRANLVSTILLACARFPATRADDLLQGDWCLSPRPHRDPPSSRIPRSATRENGRSGPPNTWRSQLVRRRISTVDPELLMSERTAISIGLAAAFTTALAAATGVSADPIAGQNLAEKWCAQCHGVRADRLAPNLSAPTFRSWRRSLRSPNIRFARCCDRRTRRCPRSPSRPTKWTTSSATYVVKASSLRLGALPSRRRIASGIDPDQCRNRRRFALAVLRRRRCPGTSSENKRPMTLLPNLRDYDAVREAFTWKAVRAELAMPGGLNIAYQALDRHVAEGRGDKLHCAGSARTARGATSPIANFWR